ncbi:sulfonate transport system substrate-binding protein [Sinosporangium album]|uniref:Putative aliphatic sulfonates-binding protein n=1 Tax=Sinosporangium album TaxID=504805 RepID=A0A1G7T523_9ACTN|nr:ABC transporter substrate-binding protein [Sinosporangium album]SDG30396.1 sulfonate transport system substrate-binding protein [Sinosporangium album]
MRHLTAALLLLTALAMSTACSAARGAEGAEVVTVRLPDPGNAGVLALGKKDGSLAKALEKVNAEIEWTGQFGAFAPTAQAINSGQLDYGVGSITSGIGALAAKPSFKIFAVAEPDLAGEGILVKEGGPVREIADLAGRKVAVNKGGTGEYLLLKALDQHDIAPGEVERVYLPPADAATAFNAGQVDAWASWGAFVPAAQANSGARFLADGAALQSDNYQIHVVSTALAQRHPRVVHALYDYLHTGSVAIRANPASYVNVFTGAGPTAVTGRLKELTEVSYAQDPVIKAVADADLPRFAAVADFFARRKVTTSVVPVKEHLIDPVKAGS